jgi:hypothetical protein
MRQNEDSWGGVGQGADVGRRCGDKSLHLLWRGGTVNG